MLKNPNEIIDYAISVVKNLKKSDRISLVHHDDSDGCCSAALFSILIHNLTGDYPLLFPVRGIEDITKKLITDLRFLGLDYVFVFDITAHPRMFEGFRGFILDHHVFKDIEDTETMKYINPHSFEKDDEKVPPVCFMVYKILNSLFSEEKVAWIAGIGITEDHHVDTCKELFEKIKEDDPEILKVNIDQFSVERSFFGELCDMIRSGRMIKGREGAKTAVLSLIECRDRPDKFMNGLTQHSYALRKFYDRVKYETQGFLKDVERKGEFFKEKKVIFYEHGKTRIGGLTSFISDKMRQKYPEWIVCSINKEYGNKKSKMSIRLEQKERKEDLVSILEKIKENVSSLKGGGHRSAVGVLMDLNDIDEFKKEFLKVI